MKIYLVRHGQTDWNAAFLMQGRSDIPLNAEGIRIAERTGETFFSGRFPVERLYCSKLFRAIQTAGILGKYMGGLEPLVVEGLEEMSFGEWEGMSLPEIQAKYPEEAARWRTDFLMPTPGGESHIGAGMRGMETLNMLAEEETGDFAVVAHGALIRAMLTILTHSDYSELKKYTMPNCGIAQLEYDPLTREYKLLGIHGVEAGCGSAIFTN